MKITVTAKAISKLSQRERSIPPKNTQPTQSRDQRNAEEQIFASAVGDFPALFGKAQSECQKIPCGGDRQDQGDHPPAIFAPHF